MRTDERQKRRERRSRTPSNGGLFRDAAPNTRAARRKVAGASPDYTSMGSHSEIPAIRLSRSKRGDWRFQLDQIEKWEKQRLTFEIK